jgi:hypothetical protein
MATTAGIRPALPHNPITSHRLAPVDGGTTSARLNEGAIAPDDRGAKYLILNKKL